MLATVQFTRERKLQQVVGGEYVQNTGKVFVFVFVFCFCFGGGGYFR